MLDGHVRLLAEGGPGIGMGHLARSSALGCALRFRGFELEARVVGLDRAAEIDGIHWEPVTEAVGAPEGGLTVVDGYGLAARLRTGAPVFSMHAAWPEGAPCPKASLEIGGPTEGASFTSLRYACLRAPFWLLDAQSPSRQVSRVLVTTGGGDGAARSDRLALDLRAALPAEVQVLVIRGPFSSGRKLDGVEVLSAPPDLAQHLATADLALTAAGQTMLEAMAAGTPTVAAPLASDQAAQAAAAAATGGVVVAPPDEMIKLARDLHMDWALRRGLARRGSAAVDGLGAHRLATELLRAEIDSPGTFPGIARLELVPARESDSGFLLALRNDPAVQVVSRRTDKVGSAEHRAWLQSVLNDPARHLYLLRSGGMTAGQVRLDLTRSGCELSISLGPDQRSSGLGRRAIASGVLLAITELEVKAVDAWIGVSNAASEAAFSAAGFRRTEDHDDRGFSRWTCTRRDLFARVS